MPDRQLGLTFLVSPSWYFTLHFQFSEELPNSYTVCKCVISRLVAN